MDEMNTQFTPKPDIDEYKSTQRQDYIEVKNTNSIVGSKWFWIAIITIIVLVIPYLSRTIKDSKSLESNELLGQWKSSGITFTFNADGTFTTDNQYISGHWNVVNADERIVNITYCISGEQVNAYNSVHRYDYDENEAIDLTPQEVMDIVLYESNLSFPEEGNYEYIRSEEYLCYNDDDDINNSYSNIYR